MSDQSNAASRPVTKVRVLIVDQDPLVRRVVRETLSGGDISVVAEATDGLEAVRFASEHLPDVVLMDILLPELDGPTAIRQIVSASPVVRVVVLTAAREADAGISALKAGASGYLNKGVDLSALPRIIRAVANGEAAVARSFVSVMIDRLRSTPEGNIGLRPVRSALTAREWEVLDLLSSGLTTEEVTDALVVSSETVRSHLQRAMRKLGVHSKEAAIEAVREVRATAGARGEPLAG